MERVAVIFFNADNVPLEKFVFKLAMNQAYDSEVEEVDLEFSLRSFLIKLSNSESLSKGLPPGKCDCTYVCCKDFCFYFSLISLWLNGTFGLATRITSVTINSLN